MYIYHYLNITYQIYTSQDFPLDIIDCIMLTPDKKKNGNRNHILLQFPFTIWILFHKIETQITFYWYFY